MARNDNPTKCKFTVRGSGQFPTDMLRYDSCWPADPVSAGHIAGHIMDDSAGRRDVVLCSINPRSLLTPDRWRSFGWTIVGYDGMLLPQFAY